MTIKELKTRLREYGMTARGIGFGLYCVNFAGGAAGTAYYTTDSDDALAIGINMSRRAARLADLRDADPAPGVGI